MQMTHQIFIAILHFNEVTVDVVEVEAARESLVIGSVWGMARERMQDNDEEKLQNTGEDYKLTLSISLILSHFMQRFRSGPGASSRAASQRSKTNSKGGRTLGACFRGTRDNRSLGRE